MGKKNWLIYLGFFLLGGVCGLILCSVLTNNFSPVSGWMRKKLPDNLELSEVYSIGTGGKFYNVSTSKSTPEMHLIPQSIAFMNGDNLAPELETAVSRVVVSGEKYFYVLDLEDGVIYGPGLLSH